MFPIKYEHEHFLPIFCLMHHVRPCFGSAYIFPFSRQEKDISKFFFFNWELPSKAIEFVDWDMKQRSSSKWCRIVLGLWRSCAVSWESLSQASQTFEDSSDNFAELHHTLCSCQTWAWLSLRQHKQNTGHNLVRWPVKLNERRCARSNLGSNWVLKLDFKAHCNLSAIFGLTIFVLQPQNHSLHFQ